LKIYFRTKQFQNISTRMRSHFQLVLYWPPRGFRATERSGYYGRKTTIPRTIGRRFRARRIGGSFWSWSWTCSCTRHRRTNRGRALNSVLVLLNLTTEVINLVYHYDTFIPRHPLLVENVWRWMCESMGLFSRSRYYTNIALPHSTRSWAVFI